MNESYPQRSFIPCFRSDFSVAADRLGGWGGALGNFITVAKNIMTQMTASVKETSKQLNNKSVVIVF